MEEKRKSKWFLPSEEQYLNEITAKYSEELQRLEDLLTSLDIERDRDAYLAAAREYTTLTDKQNAEVTSILNDRDKRIIESYNGDTEKLAEDLKKQLGNFFRIAKLVDKPLKPAEIGEDGLPVFDVKEKLYDNPKALYENYVEVNKIFLDHLKKEDPYTYGFFVQFLKDTWVDIYGRNKDYSYIDGNTDIYRTRAKAVKDGAYDKQPTSIASPTLAPYQYSLSLYKNDYAYLQPLKTTDGLKFKDGKVFFEQMRQLSEAELQDMHTKEGIQSIDLPILKTYYSIILGAFEDTNRTKLNEVITMYVPDLAEIFGQRRNLNKAEITQLIDKTRSFHNIVGIMNETRNGQRRQSVFPILNFEGYNANNNTIAFSSPYMNYLIRSIYKASIRKDSKGKPKLSKKGEPLRLPSHSYLIDSSITKEKNKAAVENVFLIVTLIEQAGDNIPRIKASTLVERNVQFAERLKETANPRVLLSRTFTKTWELLRTKTRLLEVYKDIKLPDPNDPAFMPTIKTLDSTVFSFPHNGKRT